MLLRADDARNRFLRLIVIALTLDGRCRFLIPMQKIQGTFCCSLDFARDDCNRVESVGHEFLA